MATEKTYKTPMSEDASSPKKRKAELEELEVNLEAPEPPSKRAKRAQKKGKTLPPKQDSDDEKEAKKEEKEKLKSNRSEHGVWVGNMPFAVTPDMLRKWLIENSGEVITNESITRINMPMTKDGGNKVNKNKGFAYVDFADIGAKVAAIALTENELLYRKLLIKDSTSYDGRPKKDEAEIAAAAKKKVEDEIPTSRKIFVGNLSFQTTEEDVRANFEKCGEIDWVKVDEGRQGSLDSIVCVFGAGLSVGHGFLHLGHIFLQHALRGSNRGSRSAGNNLLADIRVSLADALKDGSQLGRIQSLEQSG
ncbi:hypothetical protein BN1723_003988, partial [Verticillium longisporum]